ncbi:hypothetical protein ACIRBY_17130 [Streptomyces sp. NPDC096136]|uniref:hypothetical protein n=1 Tax=Streptomyces sp. NPDC096136 TaxID=3366076 RepID=UPI0037FAC4B7
MDEQGGAGGVPLHGDEDPQQRRRPHAARPAPRESRSGPELGPVRREDTDEASRLDRPGTPDPDDPRGDRRSARHPDRRQGG